jgi:hypothetical protein
MELDVCLGKMDASVLENKSDSDITLQRTQLQIGPFG